MFLLIRLCDGSVRQWCLLSQRVEVGPFAPVLLPLQPHQPAQIYQPLEVPAARLLIDPEQLAQFLGGLPNPLHPVHGGATSQS